MLELAKAYESGVLPLNLEAAQRWAARAEEANVPGAAAVQSSVRSRLQRSYATAPSPRADQEVGYPIAESSPYARVMPASVKTASPVRPLSEVDQLRQRVDQLSKALNDLRSGSTNVGGSVAAAGQADVVDIEEIRAVEHRSLNQLGMDAHARATSRMRIATSPVPRARMTLMQ